MPTDEQKARLELEIASLRKVTMTDEQKDRLELEITSLWRLHESYPDGYLGWRDVTREIEGMRRMLWAINELELYSELATLATLARFRYFDEPKGA